MERKKVKTMKGKSQREEKIRRLNPNKEV